jgi:double-stranded uracil-DNA glycosylase
VKLLFVGVNPGLRTAAVGAPFANRSNRFWRALLGAGLVDRLIDTSEGFDAVDQEHLDRRGIGIIALVARPTARADELDDRELTEGVVALEARVAELDPRVVAFLGVTAYRIAFDRPHAGLGRQPEAIAGRPLWIVPNPSGRNAHAGLPALVAAYREVGVAAGIEPYPS